MYAAFLAFIFTIEMEHSIFKPYRFAFAEEETRKELAVYKCSSETTTTRGEKITFPRVFGKRQDRSRRKTESHRDVGRSVKNTLAFPRRGRAHELQPIVQITSVMRSMKSRRDLPRPRWLSVQRFSLAFYQSVPPKMEQSRQQCLPPAPNGAE